MFKARTPASSIFSKLKDYAQLFYKSPKRILQEESDRKNKVIEWHLKRLVVISRDGHRCAICRSITSLGAFASSAF